MKFKHSIVFTLVLLFLTALTSLISGGIFGEPDTQKWEDGFDNCTSILVGKLASVDGSTMTSHSCDSSTDRTWINIVPHKKHQTGDAAKLYFESKRTKGPDDPDRLDIGEIPQVVETYAFINTAYPVMNEHQLDAIIAPTGGPAWVTDLVNGDHSSGGSSTPAAVAGYPNITVPMGFIRGLPVGLSFFGRAWSESRLIGLAYAFEQGTKVRRAPEFLPTLDLS